MFLEFNFKVGIFIQQVLNFDLKVLFSLTQFEHLVL